MSGILADVERRRPVWLALSDLFLDTELDEADLCRIGDSLARTPFGVDELELMLFRDVYPVCIRNLSSFAGEWAGFNPAWLEAEILRRGRRRWKWPAWLQMGRWRVRSDWQRVKARVLEMRA